MLGINALHCGSIFSQNYTQAKTNQGGIHTKIPLVKSQNYVGDKDFRWQRAHRNVPIGTRVHKAGCNIVPVGRICRKRGFCSLRNVRGRRDA